jgi:Xaa-Pro aminopeptidase
MTGGADGDEDDASAQVMGERLARLRAVMAAHEVEVLVTADPIDILYATGVRNMSIFSMMGPSRFALVTPTVVLLWEYPGCEHLAAASVVDEVRPAPSITPVFDPGYQNGVDSLAGQLIDATIESVSSSDPTIGVERLELDICDALRDRGARLANATEVFVDARSIKTPCEIELMWASMDATMKAARSVRRCLVPGATEVEIWSEFHRALIAHDGEFVSTRLAQSGPRTFPYFQEASTRVVEDGDLFCLDTDAIGPASYAADFSRTFVCGDLPPTPAQTALHETALEQLHHNASLLQPGRTFRSFATEAWTPPAHYRPHGYSCLAHGLGLCGEYPYVPVASAEPWTLDGRFEPGMVICVESYIGSPADGEGVKVEDQYLITEDSADLMSTMEHQLDA